MKKFFYILLIIILALFAIKHKKIFRYFEEQRYYTSLVNIGLLKPCYSPHLNIIDIFSEEGFNYFEKDQEVTSLSLKKLNDDSDLISLSPKIPLVTHHAYVTPQNSGKSLETFYIEVLKSQFQALNKLDDSWQHYIWTNNSNIIPLEIKQIKGVVIKNIDEFKGHQSYPQLLDILRKSEKDKPFLAQATDLIRLLAVQKFGGIYADMDYEIYDFEYIFNLLHRFDFIGARETIRITSFYANCFFAAKPNHPVINNALERNFRNYNNYKMPNYVKYPCNLYDKILFSGPVLMTIAYFEKNNINGNNDIILPSWMAVNVDFSRYKNNNCKLSEITEIYYSNRQNHLEDFIENFTLNPILEDWQKTCNKDFAFTNNIYYNSSFYRDYKIIGSDPMCGTWVNKGVKHKKYHYLNW